ncbi:hypothetical protein FIBSPDRAFT_406409 [Athelia psychrophila]|uniref:FAR-17a/AIG1-like protein n=1 Tax=Athelia psychrophila TaxID=1759441 RepID=A0A166N8X0_9AGAM|nr:hypothetical protein FIBSPDRAFT_406409 [Fibularhizoctonia sp. CBS 109695]
MSFNQAAVLLHGTAAAILGYGYNSLHGLVMDEWIKTQKGGHFQFLTIIGIAWATMVASLVTDIFPSFTAMRKLKRALLMTSLPLAVVISSIYWSLLLLFPSLILQTNPNSEPSSSSDALVRIPVSVDLSLHAAPGLALLADFMLFQPKFSKNEARYAAPVLVTLLASSYGWWVEYCASINGTFPYPFLTENPFNIRVGIYGGAATLALVSFWIINSLHPNRSRPN